MKGEGKIKPMAHEIEAYKQAHENRRKWESYIWQYGVIVLALIGFIAGRISNQESASAFINIGIIDKLVMTILAIFLGSTLLNVYRARILMKQLERSIHTMHEEWGVKKAIVPYELDLLLTKKQQMVSSTQVAIWAHLLLFITVSIATLVAWWIY